MTRRKTKYIIAGTGSMPVKEAKEALFSLGGGEAVLVFHPDQAIKFCETVLKSSNFDETVLALTDTAHDDILPPQLDEAAGDVVSWDAEYELGEDADITLLVLSTGTEDAFLHDLVEKSLEAGIRVRALNDQLYDVTLAADLTLPSKDYEEREQLDPEPDEAPTEGEGPVPEIPSSAELQKMSRNDLKELAQKVGVVPEDRRQKDSYIDALLEAQAPEDDGYEAPSEDDGADLDRMAEQLNEVEAVKVEGVDVQIPDISSRQIDGHAPVGEIQQALDDTLAALETAIREIRSRLRG